MAAVGANNLSEIWSQFAFLMPGLLGDRRGFARRFRTPIGFGGIFEPPTIPLAVDHEARDLRCSILSFLR
jgi:SNF2 family DNA or RNA helicase